MTVHDGQHPLCDECDRTAHRRAERIRQRVTQIRAAFPGMDQEVRNGNDVIVGYLLEPGFAISTLTGRLFAVGQDMTTGSPTQPRDARRSHL